MAKLSTEQQFIVDSPLVPLSVIACPGSGKTLTAVHRLVEMRRRLGEQRGRIVLLSFSKVAVKTFRDAYRGMSKGLEVGVRRDLVEIETIDSFITSNVLRPHAHRVMGSRNLAFLVSGNEPFLNGFRIRGGNFPSAIKDLEVSVENGEICFKIRDKFGYSKTLDQRDTHKLVARLGRTGAYTHDLGRYWCHRVLCEEPSVLSVLARRYPHIIVDEAQDIGALHSSILEKLASAGSQISLIGDPCQGIYEFAGADGQFLRKYGAESGVANRTLTINFRSVPSILTISNRLSNRGDTTDRHTTSSLNGARFAAYAKDRESFLVDAFVSAVKAAGLDVERSAVVCRSSSLVQRVTGDVRDIGQGLVKKFAGAAILRDKSNEYLKSFNRVVECVLELLEDPPNDLSMKINRAGYFPEMRTLLRRIWKFTRNPETGLPHSTLSAKAQWQPKLVDNCRQLLNDISSDCGLKICGNFNRKLTKANLTDGPLLLDIKGSPGLPQIRVTTVHQVKGESLDAVLYLADKTQIIEMLKGVDTEVGRIGYVAVTRARDLFLLGVPEGEINVLRPRLVSSGFGELHSSPLV